MPGSAGRGPGTHVATQSREPASGRHYPHASRHYPKVQNGGSMVLRQ